MFRAYIGNLDQSLGEEALLSLFREHGLSPTTIQVRRGFAFVDCPDQQTLDRTIDKLNGKMIFLCVHCLFGFILFWFNLEKGSEVWCLQWHARFSKWPAGLVREHAGHHQPFILTPPDVPFLLKTQRDTHR